MKAVIDLTDLPDTCFECYAYISRTTNHTNGRLEPASLYWNEEKHISFCCAQHSLDNYERDRG